MCLLCDTALLLFGPQASRLSPSPCAGHRAMADACIPGLSIDISHMKYVSSAPTVHQIVDHFFTKTAL